MARHIHVHLHETRDSWEESKHPRADDGKFGSGGGSSAPKAKKGEVHFTEAKDAQGRTFYRLIDKTGEHVGSASSLAQARAWWADHGGKKAAEAYDRGESGLRESTVALKNITGDDEDVHHTKGDLDAALAKVKKLKGPDGQGFDQKNPEHAAAAKELHAAQIANDKAKRLRDVRLNKGKGVRGETRIGNLTAYQNNAAARAGK